MEEEAEQTATRRLQTVTQALALPFNTINHVGHPARKRVVPHADDCRLLPFTQKFPGRRSASDLSYD